MNDKDAETILAVATAISTCLLIISELLGMSNCKSNSILQLYSNFHVCGGGTDDEGKPPKQEVDPTVYQER